MNRRKDPVSLMQAVQASPGLGRLCELADESSARLRCITPLLPATLRGAIRPGPINGEQWCLLLNNAAAAAKVRQLLPALQAHLRSNGWQVNAIRLKVQLTQA